MTLAIHDTNAGGHLSDSNRAAVKSAFLLIIAEGHSVSFACRQVEVTRMMVWKWREMDSDFNEQYTHALEARADWYEDRMHDQAAKGNIAAITLGLKVYGRLVDSHQVTLNDQLGSKTVDIPADGARLSEVISILMGAGVLHAASDSVPNRIQVDVEDVTTKHE